MTRTEISTCFTAGAFSIPKTERKLISIINAELNTQLYRKMFAEQEQYRQQLLAMTPEEILRNAYEYTIKEDIILSLEYNDLTDKQCQALLKSAHPLQDTFDAWEKHEGSHMEEVLSIIEERADTAIREDRGKSHREER